MNDRRNIGIHGRRDVLMKIVVIGGSGLIGSKVVERLRKAGHDVLAASPSSGVNSLTGEGLDAAMTGADVVIDVSNSPSFEDKAVLAFFETSSRNLLAAATKAGVGHHVALSVVGTDRLAASGYFRGKIAQETLIRGAGVPYTIVHATQFFEFLQGIATSGAAGDEVHLTPALIQPIGSDDVAEAVVAYALGKPLNATVEIGGPEAFPLAELVRRFMAIIGDPRKVVADDNAPYFGAMLDERTLLPGPGARIGTLDFAAWIAATHPATAGAASPRSA
jgi:uncharacterized protein YbjT (DUF2867 family)